MRTLQGSDQTPSAASAHRSVASQDSQRSGIAASAISFGGESLRLSQFPNPPTEIPTTPLQSEFGPRTPTKPNFSSRDTPAVVPKRSHQDMPSASSVTDPLTCIAPRPLQLPDASGPRGRGSNTSSPKGSTRSRTLPRHRLQASANSNPSPRATPTPSPSPYTWQEGTPGVDLDPAEDRLLSTSFITSLLSSTELDGNTSYSPISFRTMTLPPSHAGDGLSYISASSYPPPSRLTGSPSSGYPLLPAQPPPRLLPAHSHPDARGPPPSSYPPTMNVTARPSSVDSVTLHSASGHRPLSIPGNASISRGRASGITMVGASSTKLQTLYDEEDEVSKPHVHEIDTVSGAQQAEPGLTDGFDNGNSDTSHAAPSSMLFSPAFPSTAGSHPRPPLDGRRKPSMRESQYSIKTTRTAKSYVSSFISRVSAVASGHSVTIRSPFRSRTTKPLPPIPTFPHLSVVAEAERRRLEERLPMPQLVNRADTLAKMLEKGDYPHNSLDPARQEKLGAESFYDHERMNRRPSYARHVRLPSARDRKPKEKGRSAMSSLFSTAPYRCQRNPASKTQQAAIAACVLTLVLIVVAIAVGVTVTKRRKSSPVCTGALTGEACNLNATCVCTTSLPGQCGDLASGLISLIPTVNMLFKMNLTPTSLSVGIWTALGETIGGNCAPQVLLVDVSSGLDPVTMPNRTLWAQSTLLWNLVQSQDLATVKKIRSFVNSAPWDRLSNADGPAQDTAAKFQISASGFLFDFASQTISQPNVSFVSDARPTNAQITRVDSVAQGVLDRMYSYALASSTQRQAAWATYWRTTLQQRPELLPVFMSSIASSPILVPFNASSLLNAGLLTNSTNTSFPPPLGCYPTLLRTHVDRLNNIESNVFGLPPLSSNTNNRFNAACFPTRPLYGVLDILQLRLPFVDSRTHVARQAAVLKRDVAPRAVIYSGELLSALPSTSSLPDITILQANPRQFGTLNHFSHVMLNFFASIPDINVARALVNFVLSSSTAPPGNNTLLFQSLSSLPTLEVAIFGTIDPSDVSSSVSSFAEGSGLFFGSDPAAALRSWAITGTNSSVVWTEFASSPQVVRDSSLTDSVFNSVWIPAYNFLHSANPGVTVGVSNITNAFRAVGRFSS